MANVNQPYFGDPGDIEAPAPIQQVQTSQVQLPDWLSNLIKSSASQAGNLNQQGMGFATQAANQYQTGFGVAPQLQVAEQYQAPQGLDAFAQSQVSRGTQDLQAQAAAQRAQVAQQFRGQPGLSNILQSQTSRQAALNQNPLLAQAAQQQSARNLQEYQANLQGTELANRAIMGQGQDQLQRDMLGNQALIQQLGLNLTPGQLAQSNLSNYSGLANLFGTQQTTGQEQLTPGAQQAMQQYQTSGGGGGGSFLGDLFNPIGWLGRKTGSEGLANSPFVNPGGWATDKAF